MGMCRYCHKSAKTISDVIGFCVSCIRHHFQEVWPEIKRVHDRSRRVYQLPQDPPRAADGRTCPLCMHRCQIPEGARGFCGLRRLEGGTIREGRPHEGNLSYYYDPLPTNCVGAFVCPAGTGCGYPRYTDSKGPEYGHKNLAVFYHACSFNCLYCQNYQYKQEAIQLHRVTAKELARAVDDRTNCICYFGGDPAPQILHAIKTSKLASYNTSKEILRICWETNGCVNEPFLTMMAQLSLKSGGCIKFDLKAWSESIHYALCDVTNRKTLENFKVLSNWISKRPEPPFLIASTLLVPGYVDEEEVAALASYIANLNPDIPYSLLAFYPHFALRDLPTTSRAHALRCKSIAQSQGVHNVHIGNVHLLGEEYQ